MTLTNLIKMKNDQWGRVETLEGDDGLCFRLMELGFTPGELVRRVASSPFNDPIVVAIRGTSFALRQREAGCIQIEPLD